MSQRITIIFAILAFTIVNIAGLFRGQNIIEVWLTSLVAMVGFAVVGFCLGFVCRVVLVILPIIHIYLLSLIVILISMLQSLVLSGLSLISYLLYLFLTRVEFFLYVLFLLESFSNLFQSLTLANRLSINLIAGSLLTFLLSSSLGLALLSLYIFILLLLVFKI